MARAFAFRYLFLLVLLLCAARRVAFAAEPSWIRVSSAHFSVLTDAGEKNGRDVILRFEQMRSVFAQLLSKTKVNMPVPLDIIAVKGDEEYARIAPLQRGKPISAPGFFLAGEDRDGRQLAGRSAPVCASSAEFQLSADPGLVRRRVRRILLEYHHGQPASPARGRSGSDLAVAR